MTAYDNTDTYLGIGYTNGGASGTPLTTVLVADDINFASGSAGSRVKIVTLSAYNTGSASLRVNINAWFYAADGQGGGPGTLLGSFRTIPLVPPGVRLISIIDGAGGSFFTVPTSERIWAGVSFDGRPDNLTSASTLNQYGQGVYGPARVGSSGDRIFVGRQAAPTRETTPWERSPNRHSEGTLRLTSGGVSMCNRCRSRVRCWRSRGVRSGCCGVGGRGAEAESPARVFPPHCRGIDWPYGPRTRSLAP